MVKNYFEGENLLQDPIHGYIRFTSSGGGGAGEVFERDLIDSPWVQRLRQIHQLQTAWWVFPSAEHTRFQHVVGSMHLASRATEAFYPSLREVCPDVPSRAMVESLLRIAALLHDVGHGPFGHFFDTFFLHDHDLTHETLGAEIIRRELGELIRRIRRNPSGELADGESLDPDQVAFLVVRPKRGAPTPEVPRWLILLRGLFSGLYTVDNMDFVLRDAYMTGFSSRSFDLDRLLHYSFFTDQGVTIHHRGFYTLTRFINMRAEMFRSIYFHRTVRAIDLTLEDLFHESKHLLFQGNPLEKLDDYLRFTEWSLLVDVASWDRSEDPEKRRMAEPWQRFLRREIPWQLVCERTILFSPGEKEHSTIFANEVVFEAAVRDALPERLKNLPLRVDTARHVHRPGAHLPAAGQNHLFDPSIDRLRHLEEEDLYHHIPQSYRICRIYAESDEYQKELAAAMESLMSDGQVDDLTNM
jgi:hypothetical protein